MRIISFITFIACSFLLMISSNKADRLQKFNIIEYKNNLKILSHDSMQGRLPGTEGGMRAANYIASQFKKCGLSPIYDESYFQQVNIYSYQPDYKKTNIVISGENFRENIVPFNEMVFFTKQNKQLMQIEGDMVFVGYGIVAPEYNWNDYKDADVKDKIVVCLLNHPDFQSPDFDKKQTTYHGTFHSRAETAYRKGAKGILFVFQKELPFKFTLWQNFIINMSFGDYSFDSKIDLVSFIKEGTFDRVLHNLNMSTDDLVTKANNKNFHPFPMSMELNTSFEQVINNLTSPNIVGYIRGTEHPDEAFIYMAHYDHFGVSGTERGDSIYNGAIDNASGTAGIISLARYFSTHPQKRTIIFLATTAEEMAFQGVLHYIKNPVIPLSKTIAGMNLDMMNFFGKSDSTGLTPIVHTDAVEPLKQLTSKENLALKLSKSDNAYHAFRTEIYPFALYDVLVMNLESEQNPEKLTSLSDDRLNTIIQAGGLNYHTPFDEIKPWFSYDGILQQLELAKQIGLHYANDGIKPEFNTNNPYLPARKMWVKTDPETR